VSPGSGTFGVPAMSILPNLDHLSAAPAAACVYILVLRALLTKLRAENSWQCVRLIAACMFLSSLPALVVYVAISTTIHHLTPSPITEPSSRKSTAAHVSRALLLRCLPTPRDTRVDKLNLPPNIPHLPLYTETVPFAQRVNVRAPYQRKGQNYHCASSVGIVV
jgi:hypothetical protein